MTLVVDGPAVEASQGVGDEAVDALIASLLDEGASARDVAAAVAERTGRKRSEVYPRVLALRSDDEEV